MKLYGNFGRLESVTRVQVKVERTSPSALKVFLLLDGRPHHNINLSDHRVTSADFGIYENTPWYDVAFPGEGWEELKEDVPTVVFETLKRLVQMVRGLINTGTETIVDITADLKSTGCRIYVGICDDTTAEIYSRRFKEKTG